MSDEQSNQNPQVPANPSGTDGQQAPPAAPKTPESPDIAKIIQSETDKVRTEYSKQFKAQQAMIDELKKSQMTETELRKYKDSQLQERESVLQRKELELLAVDVLREHDIPLNLREFIVGKDADETKARAASLKAEFQKAVETAVAERFKANGREPPKGETAPAGKRYYTRAEVESITKKVMLPGTPQKERESTMAELQAAMREGRIKN
jgi:hypothetical protein